MVHQTILVSGIAMAVPILWTCNCDEHGNPGNMMLVNWPTWKYNYNSELWTCNIPVGLIVSNVLSTEVTRRLWLWYNYYYYYNLPWYSCLLCRKLCFLCHLSRFSDIVLQNSFSLLTKLAHQELPIWSKTCKHMCLVLNYKDFQFDLATRTTRIAVQVVRVARPDCPPSLSALHRPL